MKNIIVCGILFSGGIMPQIVQSAVKKGAEPAKPARPNILYIMSDDHSYQTVGCYGYNLIETPNLDRIAKSGMFFRNCFVANSLSGPARAVVLTGKFSHINGYLDNESHSAFNQDQMTFPKMLHSAGYNTAIFGKWHLNSVPPQGFDYYSILDGQGNYFNPDFIEPGGTRKVPGYVTNLTVDRTLKWMQQERDPKKPFMVMCHFKAPHRNWMANLDKLPMYEDKTFPLPDNFYDDYQGRLAAEQALMRIDHNMHLYSDLKMFGCRYDNPGGPGAGELDENWSRMTDEQKQAFLNFYGKIEKDFLASNLKGRELGEWKYQRFMRDYAKVISSVDDNVGRLIDYLQKNGLWENTIVIYTSDQGAFMGEHGWFDKRFIYEQTFRTPFLVSYPAGIPKTMPKENKALIQSIDFCPTFLDYAGVAIPKDVQGVSIRPILEGKEPKVREAVYYHFYEYPAFHAVKRHYGCRTDRYKIVHFYNDIDKWELYDLSSDPEEMHNLYYMPGNERLRDSMKTVLHDLQAKYKETNIIDPTNDGYKPHTNQVNNY